MWAHGFSHARNQCRIIYSRNRKGDQSVKSAQAITPLLLGAFCLSLLSPISQAQTKSAPPTVEDARKFIESAEQELFELGNKAQRAAWVQANFITDDTEQIAAD